MDKPQNSHHAIKEQGRNALCVDLHRQLTWNRKEAATMCGVSVNMFNDWVRAGFMPQPMRNRRFSASAVRRALNDNPEIATQRDRSPLEEWEVTRG